MALAICVAAGGCATPRHETPNPAERAILSTYVVASGKAMGTGFLVSARSPGDGEVLVLVTSTHVVSGSEGEPVDVYLRFVTPQGDAFVAPVPLSTRFVGQTYAVHPFCDVAAFRIDRPLDVPTWAVLPSVQEHEIDALREMRAGGEVVFAGFPEGNGGPAGVFAVLRRGTIASFDQSFLGFPFFAVNAAVYPGDSGAPVFITPPQGRPKLVGMVVEYLTDSAERPMPLAMAIDARAIRETITALMDTGVSRTKNDASRDAPKFDDDRSTRTGGQSAPPRRFPPKKRIPHARASL